MSKSTNHHRRDWVAFDDKSGSYKRLECRRQEEREHSNDMREALHEMAAVDSVPHSSKVDY